jgi:hypothetical protein
VQRHTENGRGIRGTIYHHVLRKDEVVFEQFLPAGAIAMYIDHHVWLPASHEGVNCACFRLSEQEVVPIQIDAVCVQARSGGSAVRVYVSDNGDTYVWKSTRSRIMQKAGSSRRGIEFVAVLSGHDENPQEAARIAAVMSNDRPAAARKPDGLSAGIP